MTAPYYADDLVTLYHGDCRDITDWLTADILLTDPPYGREWRQGTLKAAPGRAKGTLSTGRTGIEGDLDTGARDEALDMWLHDNRPAIVFGDLMLPPPYGTKQVGVYRKPPDAGVRGTTGGVRRDIEALYWLGAWPSGIGGRSSVFTTSAPVQGSPSGTAARYGHPHAKPLDVMEELVSACPPGVIADPFAGSGSTLVAARNLGRKAIGVEIDEAYCERIARRIDQGVLDFGGAA